MVCPATCSRRASRNGPSAGACWSRRSRTPRWVSHRSIARWSCRCPSSSPTPPRTCGPPGRTCVARVMPFDLVIDEHTADGQEARVSKTSVAGNWGAVAGSLRFFADRFGIARAGIEGTTLSYDLVRSYAVSGPAKVVLTGPRKHQRLAAERRRSYFGFDLDTEVEPIPGRIPDGAPRRTPVTCWPKAWRRGRSSTPTRAACAGRSRRSTSCGAGQAARWPALAPAALRSRIRGAAGVGGELGRFPAHPPRPRPGRRWWTSPPGQRSKRCRRACGSAAMRLRSTTSWRTG